MNWEQVTLAIEAFRRQIAAEMGPAVREGAAQLKRVRVEMRRARRSFVRAARRRGLLVQWEGKQGLYRVTRAGAGRDVTIGLRGLWELRGDVYRLVNSIEDALGA